MRFTTSVAAVLAVTSSALAVVSSAAGNSIVAYWGQGNINIPLSDVCSNPNVDIVVLSFVNVFPDQSASGWPGTNFGSSCGGQVFQKDQVDTQLLDGAHCGTMIPDIADCRAGGKKVLLSLGGGYPTDQWLHNDTSAVSFADFLIGAFGAPSNTWNGPRPIGASQVDGFDLDIESDLFGVNPTYPGVVPAGTTFPDYKSRGYAAMANHIHSSGYLVSGAPQCVRPDAHLGPALSSAWFDYVFVQFYNTPGCSAMDYIQGTGSFNFNAWANAAYVNPLTKVYIGLPASTDSANAGFYLTPTQVSTLLNAFSTNLHFGGVMLWEATSSARNLICGNDYAWWVRKALEASYAFGGTFSEVCPSSTSSSAIASSTSSVASSTSSSVAITTSSSSIISTTASSSTWSSIASSSSSDISSSSSSVASSSSSDISSSSSYLASSTSSDYSSTSSYVASSTSSDYSSTSSYVASSTSSDVSSSTSSDYSSTSSYVASSTSSDVSSTSSDVVSSTSSDYSSTSSDVASSTSSDVSSSSSSDIYSSSSTWTSSSIPADPTITSSTMTSYDGSSSTATWSATITSSYSASDVSSSSSSESYSSSDSSSSMPGSPDLPSTTSSTYSITYTSSYAETTSSSSYSYYYPNSTYTTATSSSEYDPSTSSTSSAYYYDDPSTTSSSSSSAYYYDDPSTTPSSSSAYYYDDPSATSSSSVYYYDDPSSSTPVKPTVTSRPSYSYDDPSWTATSVYTTTITTTYVDVCPTGLTTITATYKTTVCPGSTTPAVPVGWTTTVTVLTNMGPKPTTVTITKPYAPSTAVEIVTLVVKPVPANEYYSSLSTVVVPSAAAAPVKAAPSYPVAPIAASGRPVAASGYPVAPVGPSSPIYPAKPVIYSTGNGYAVPTGSRTGYPAAQFTGAASKVKIGAGAFVGLIMAAVIAM